MHPLQLALRFDPRLLEKGDITNGLLVRIAASASIFGCLCNQLLILFEKSRKKPFAKGLVGLGLANLLINIATVMTTFQVAKEDTCTSFSFFLAFGYVGSILLTCFLSHSYKTYYLSTSIDDWEKEIYSCIWSYLIISMGGAFLFAVLASFGGLLTLDETFEYCTFLRNTTQSRNIYESCIFFILVVGLPVISTIFCIYCYAGILKLEDWREARRYSLFYYPLILIICYLPLGIFEAETLFSEKLFYSLTQLVVILMNIQGIFNGLVYIAFPEMNRFPIIFDSLPTSYYASVVDRRSTLIRTITRWNFNDTNVPLIDFLVWIIYIHYLKNYWIHFNSQMNLWISAIEKLL